MGLMKEENALTRRVAKLLVNSWIPHFLMQRKRFLKLEFRNFWKSHKVFTIKNITKVAKIALMVTILTMFLEVFTFLFKRGRAYLSKKKALTSKKKGTL